MSFKGDDDDDDDDEKVDWLLALIGLLAVLIGDGEGDNGGDEAGKGGIQCCSVQGSAVSSGTNNVCESVDKRKIKKEPSDSTIRGKLLKSFINFKARGVTFGVLKRHKDFHNSFPLSS